MRQFFFFKNRLTSKKKNILVADQHKLGNTKRLNHKWLPHDNFAYAFWWHCQSAVSTWHVNIQSVTVTIFRSSSMLTCFISNVVLTRDSITADYDALHCRL